MPFLRFVTEREHKCDLPDQGRRGAMKFQPGTIWQCFICRRKWVLQLDRKSNPFWKETKFPFWTGKIA